MGKLQDKQYQLSNYNDMEIWLVCFTVEWGLVKYNIKNQPTTEIVFEQFSSKLKETSKACLTGPLWRDFTGDWWVPFTKGTIRRRKFPGYDFTPDSDWLVIEPAHKSEIYAS